MRAVTIHGAGDIRIEDKPEPKLLAPDDAIIAVELSGICGSDLHIYHGRVAIEPGFTIGHEFVGTVLEAGSAVVSAAVGDRVLGCFCTACAVCYFCRKGLYHKCDEARVFGHGAALGNLQGAQAEQLLVPRANLTLRRIPEGLRDELALFAGDVAGTGFHAIAASKLEPGDTCAVIGLGPVGLCAIQAARAAGATAIIAVDRVPERLAMAEAFGAIPVHLDEGDPRGEVKRVTAGRGVDVAVEAVGHPAALDLAVRVTHKAGTVSLTGVYAERTEVHLGLVWIKALNIVSGHANVIAHVDPVLALMSAGILNPGPLVTHRMKLDQAPEAYELYAQRAALKIALTP